MVHVSPRRRSETRFVALLVASDLAVCTASLLVAYLWRAFAGSCASGGRTRASTCALSPLCC
jgi:hypothetical protein